MIEAIVVYLILAAFVTALAGNLNRSKFMFFLLSVVASPFVAGIILLIIGKDRASEIRSEIEKENEEFEILKQRFFERVLFMDENDIPPSVKKTYRDLAEGKTVDNASIRLHLELL